MAGNSHYFIGVPIDGSILDSLIHAQNQLKENEQVAFKSWTHPSDMHITLKFLGPAADNTIERLINNLQQINQLESFSLTIGGTGFFGNPQSPRVVWAGVHKTSPLLTLQKSVEKVCEDTGFSAEQRPYRPHITLAKKWSGEQTTGELMGDEPPEQNMAITKFQLYQIHPSQTPKYEVIKEFKLK
ncbi:RNA 2',3'-cyclic phosphodiesterase [Sediminibacillus albus]|uniref:RNA 2',3'-cyclic phosphodiesterase n=1 Tax=Sediminibacillus albus TaxID=407036 RepID=A0A1G9C087_9BACI|nr:RNA 2',3'-cyclic phosphodiesterase [Sediminibacillus albus]SDK44615.1 2'-5' RNA ligase [Sediminibacillus albus]